MTVQPAVNVHDHCLGPADALVALVECGDFQCPFSARAHGVVNALRTHFGVSMRFVFRNFPLVAIDPDALCAAEAAESVAAHSGPDATASYTTSCSATSAILNGRSMMPIFFGMRGKLVPTRPRSPETSVRGDPPPADRSRPRQRDGQRRSHHRNLLHQWGAVPGRLVESAHVRSGPRGGRARS